MSDDLDLADPPRLLDLDDGPLAELVRGLEPPPALPPSIRRRVRGRLDRAIRPRPPFALVTGVVAVGVVIGGMLLWHWSADEPAPPPIPMDAATEATLDQALAEPTSEAAPSSSAVPVGESQPSPRSGEDTVEGDEAPAEDEDAPPSPASSRPTDGAENAPEDSASPEPAERPDGMAETSTRRSRPGGTLARSPEPAGRTDGRDVATIGRRFAARRGALVRCWGERSDGTGLTVRLTVNSEGRAEVEDLGDQAPEEAARCITREIESWRFSPGPMPVSVRVPLVFASSRHEPPANDTATGQLRLVTRPSAAVLVDGRATGLSTPILGLPLEVGRHELTLLTPSGQTQRVTVRIQAGETTRLNIALE